MLLGYPYSNNNMSYDNNNPQWQNEQQTFRPDLIVRHPPAYGGENWEDLQAEELPEGFHGYDDSVQQTHQKQNLYAPPVRRGPRTLKWHQNDPFYSDDAIEEVVLNDYKPNNSLPSSMPHRTNSEGGWQRAPQTTGAPPVSYEPVYDIKRQCTHNKHLIERLGPAKDGNDDFKRYVQYDRAMRNALTQQWKKNPHGFSDNEYANDMREILRGSDLHFIQNEDHIDLLNKIHPARNTSVFKNDLYEGNTSTRARYIATLAAFFQKQDSLCNNCRLGRTRKPCF